MNSGNRRFRGFREGHDPMNRTQDQHPVYVVDDEPGILRGVSLALRSAGIENVLTFDDARLVLPALEREPASVIILDLQMPHIPGTEILREVRERHPEIPVIILTANRDLERAVDCMRVGAWDYHVKPVDPDRLNASVRRARESRGLKREIDRLRNRFLSDTLENEKAFAGIVAVSDRMRSILRYAEVLAETREPILLQGETGTGKDLLARAIHEAGSPGAAFVKVSVGTLDAAGLDERLFEQGERSAARAASGGTLYLDGLDDPPRDLQTRLLELIEERGFGFRDPVRSLPPETRVILSSRRDLQAEVRKGAFRRDLFYRLQARHIVLPPLRERLEDLPFLLRHFIEEGAAKKGEKPLSLEPQLTARLLRHDYPGNVRELENMVRSAVERHGDGPLGPRDFDLPPEAAPVPSPGSPAASNHAAELLRLFGHFPTLREAEDYLIAEALKITEGNQKAAASLLRITRQTIHRRLKRRQQEKGRAMDADGRKP